MARLELFLLGSPQISLAGQVVTNFNTRKDLALLAYLAVTGTTHSRETLAALLWSDLPEENARRNLRHALTHLQKVIGPHWLTTERGIALTQENPWSVDVHSLRSAVKNLAASLQGATKQNNTAAPAALDQVLQLYRGEFLQGFHVHDAAHFEEWVLAQREELRLLLLHGLEGWVECCLGQGAYEQGLVATRRLLQLEPWAEPVHCWQMQLLAQSGRRAEALAQYESCRQVLAAELDVAPLPTTTALYQQIKNGHYHPPLNHPVPPAKAPALPVSSPPKPPARRATVAIKSTVPHNLVAPLAGFVGRQAELDLICQRLITPACRLLTIIGPGGMGKTALALAAGQQLLQAAADGFADGIFWVPLADLHAADQAEPPQTLDDNEVVGEAILRTIAEALNTEAEIQLSSIRQLQTYLRTRQLLLLLDNFEHLLSGTHALVRLLTQAPQVKALVTSRTRLNVRGESILALDKLSLPARPKPRLAQALPANLPAAAVQALQEESEAVAMFVQRAQQLDPGFRVKGETIGPLVQICQLVEGLPLGIELATSMLPMLSCHELAQGIAENLGFLEGEMRDLPREQRTLQAVFERSWRLLSPEEQQGLARLAIFPGSFHRDAATAIAGATPPQIKRLVDQSLVNKIGENRFTLHRTVRAFAEQKLQQWPEPINVLQRPYAHFYLEFLAGLEAGLFGSAYGEIVTQIQIDLDNIHTAWRWAVDHRMYSEMSHCLSALLWYYEQQGFYADVFEMCNQALHALLPMYEAQPNKSGATLTLLIGRLHTLLGLWHLRQGRFPQAHAAYEVSWSILQHEDNPLAAVYCLGFWGASLRAKDPPRSVALLTAALQVAQAQGAAWMQATLYQLLGEASLYAGDYVAAEAKTSAGHILAEQINWARGLAVSHKIMGRIHLVRGNYRQAEEHFRQSVEIARRHQINHYYLSSLIMLGEALRLQGRFAEARTYYAEARKLAQASEAVVLIAPVLWEEGSLAEQCGNYAAAKVAFTESLAIGTPNGWVHVLPTLGWALIGLGELTKAQEYFQTTLADAQARGYMPIYLEAQAGLAYLTVLQAQASQASDVQYHATITQAVTSLQQIAQHPAATQQTRARVGQLVAAIMGEEWPSPQGEPSASLPPPLRPGRRARTEAPAQEERTGNAKDGGNGNRQQIDPHIGASLDMWTESR